MLSKQQKRRLLIVLLIPAFIAGVWLTGGGYREFVHAEYYGVCNTTACYEADSFYAEQLKDFNAVYAGWGSYRLSSIYHGHIITGGLKEIIVDARTGKETFISLPRQETRDNSVLGIGDDCKLIYHNFDYVNFNASGTVEYIKGPESHHGLFRIECDRNFHIDFFYFKKPDAHDTYGHLVLESEKIASEWYGKQDTISKIAFFVPFLLLATIWFSVSFILFVIRFVRFGR